MEEKYYKVVAKEGDKLYSAWTKKQKLNRCVKEYEVGKTTRGRGTKLFIFKTFEDSKNWRCEQLYYSGIEIYECKATGVKNAPRIIPTIADLVQNIDLDSKVFWKFLYRWWREETKQSLKGEMPSIQFQEVPNGTLLANSVTLLKRVL
jgi:hypothetical protein